MLNKFIEIFRTYIAYYAEFIEVNNNVIEEHIEIFLKLINVITFV